MEKIKAILRNKWFGFIFWSLLYILWFVVWTGNLWLLLGELVIVDLYFTHFLSRLIGRRNREWCRRSPTYKFIYEWVNAIVFATVVASLIHIFVFQMYVIPSSSMESSLLIGDYLYVSKVAYGPQMPNTPVSFPFVHHTMPFSQTKKSFSECIRWPYHRLKGLRSIERNDVVVFNFPAGDTVLLQRQDATYYDVLREYQRTLGARAGREKLFRDYTVITRPVDKRENYIKRCVAIAGDSLKIVGGEVYVNDEPQAPVAGKQYMYTVMTSSPLSKYAIDKLGITEWSGGNGSNYYMLLDDERAEELRRMGNVLAVERFIYEEPNREVYPHDLTLGWNQDNYGPIWIPARGATIPLTPENMRLYRRCIEVYEGNRVEELPDGRVLLNGDDITGKPGSVSYMLQKDLLLPYRKVIDNVTLPLVINKVSKKEAREQAEPLFKTFGLDGTQYKYPSQLSGGMRQRAALLRTYLSSNGVALLDEPFSALDTITKAVIHKWYLDVMQSIDLSTVFITHDIDEAILLSDRIYILADGVCSNEIKIDCPKPRTADFNLTDEFLNYKRQIVEILHLL